jgi:hypothetical protein
MDIVKDFIVPLLALLDFANEDPSACDTIDIRINAVWTLSYLSGGGEDRSQAVVNSGAVSALMKLVKSSPQNLELMVPTLRCLGSCITGNDTQTETQTDAVLQAGFLGCAMDLLDHQSKAMIKKETCRILSKIAAGTEDHIAALLNKNDLVAKLFECAFNPRLDIRKEAVWAICNILICGTDRHMECDVSMDGIQALCIALKCHPDASLLLAVMKAFEMLLDADEQYERNYHQVMMGKYGGVCHLTELRDHSNDDVSNKAKNMILRYFEEARDDEED